jgi:hypothetical protein
MLRSGLADRLVADLAKERIVEDEGLGAGFWFKMIGIVLAGGIAALLLFLLVDAAWYRWGGLGAIIFFSALVLLWGWIYDRRHAKEYERLRREA